MIYKSYWLAGLSSGQYKLLMYRICPFSSQPPQEGGGLNTRGVGDGPGVGVIVGVGVGPGVGVIAGVAGGGQTSPGSGVAVAEAAASGVGVNVAAAWDVTQPARHNSMNMAIR